MKSVLILSLISAVLALEAAPQPQEATAPQDASQFDPFGLFDSEDGPFAPRRSCLSACENNAAVSCEGRSLCECRNHVSIQCHTALKGRCSLHLAACPAGKGAPSLEYPACGSTLPPCSGQTACYPVGDRGPAPNTLGYCIPAPPPPAPKAPKGPPPPKAPKMPKGPKGPKGPRPPKAEGPPKGEGPAGLLGLPNLPNLLDLPNLTNLQGLPKIPRPTAAPAPEGKLPWPKLGKGTPTKAPGVPMFPKPTKTGLAWPKGVAIPTDLAAKLKNWPKGAALPTGLKIPKDWAKSLASKLAKATMGPKPHMGYSVGEDEDED